MVSIIVRTAATLLLAGLLIAPSSKVQEEPSHCVVYVLDRERDGRLLVTDPVCYSDLGVALSVASGGILEPGDVPSGSRLVAGGGDTTLLSTFTLGTHFEGLNGTGSSISVVGGDCTGGYWNTGLTWANRISSSWNGCYRLRHYDLPNKSGPWVDLVGSGTKNLPSIMNNKTESVAYLGS